MFGIFMLRILLLVLFSISFGLARADAPPMPPVAAKSWVLLDYQTGTAIASETPDTRTDPASLTKLMTAYLVFDALGKGQLKLDQAVPVSTKAWKAEGSRMFIEPLKPVTVNELIYGMIVQSGNDATIALAEAVAGSEEIFAGVMNRQAQKLGMTNTNFVNSTGLPDPKHYSSARDMAILAAALIRDFPDNYKVYSTREYRYNNITQPNRNRLLWLDPNVDGVKTGHTEAAGYCLVASAKRGERRLISVVLGTASDSARARESQKLLNYGFQFYDSVPVYRKAQTISTLKVWKGAEESLHAGVERDLFLTLPRGDAQRLKAELVSQQPLVAPVAAGQKVGIVRLSLDGKPMGEYPVVANEEVPVAGFFGRVADTVRLWFK
ncbi:MAG TPA: D-alanyl-D-alanine carboxypeptidase family protein [Burkholderiales bacterium]|nr:D-alanyl-D-alanine carboxypeptidase family protein [Burkholderiales bacterium]